MKFPFLYATIKYRRDKGVSLRLGLPQDGKQEIEVCFDSDRYWEAKKVQAIYKRVEQSRALILMQLNVSRGLPSRSVESLIAKGDTRVACDDRGKRRYVITERGKRWIN